MKWMKLNEKKFNKTNLIKALREAKRSTMRIEERREISRFIRMVDENYGRKAWHDTFKNDSYVLQRILSFTYTATVVDGQNMSAMFEICGWILDHFDWDFDTYLLDYYKDMRKWNLC